MDHLGQLVVLIFEFLGMGIDHELVSIRWRTMSVPYIFISPMPALRQPRPNQAASLGTLIKKRKVAGRGEQGGHRLQDIATDGPSLFGDANLTRRGRPASGHGGGSLEAMAAHTHAATIAVISTRAPRTLRGRNNTRLASIK